jgi:fatty-acyl-CoA synthase
MTATLGAGPTGTLSDAPATTPAPPHWPPGVPLHVEPPAMHLFGLAQEAARRHPHKPFIVCGEEALSFAQFCEQAEAIAAWLQHHAGVKAGDRVLLALPNGPRWALACWGILRADAVAVPVNPNSSAQELRDLALDSGARLAFLQPERPWPRMALERIVAVPGTGPAADEAATGGTGLRDGDARRTPWHEVLATTLRPHPLQARPDDAALMPYTSGSTGRAKGCVHTHRSVMSAVVAGATWFGCGADAVFLGTLPVFHVTGFVGCLCIPLHAGATVAMLQRWSRGAAAALIQHYRVTHWHCITSMVVDLLAWPGLAQVDLSSLRSIRGGGAAMPQAVARQLKARTGLDFVEGYGLTETMAATHLNPPHRPKPQCLGLPLFGVDARILDPATLRELPRGERGEIVVHAPQLMRGYWQQPDSDAQAFVTLGGKRFLRTGDLGHVDDEGYFFMTDRLKRMINCAGYKVWPAEVEAVLYRHPAIREACVVAAPDARRGETVKALVVLRAGVAAPSAQDVMQWVRQHLGPAKRPRIVEFVPSLPLSGSGKVMWHALQEREFARASATLQGAL